MRKLLMPWKEKLITWINEGPDYTIDVIGGQIEIGYVRKAEQTVGYYWWAAEFLGHTATLYEAKEAVEKHLIDDGWEFADEKVLLLL